METKDVLINIREKYHCCEAPLDDELISFFTPHMSKMLHKNESE